MHPHAYQRSLRFKSLGSLASTVGKPVAFYSHNPVFHAKLGLFGLIGIVSIYPTIFFARNKKGGPADTVRLPSAVIWSVRLELLLLLAMPLRATLMARGIGNRVT